METNAACLTEPASPVAPPTVRMRVRRRLVGMLAVLLSQYVLVAIATAGATALVISKTSAVIVARFEAITHALGRLH